jgi:hypothetical protein
MSEILFLTHLSHSAMTYNKHIQKFKQVFPVYSLLASHGNLLNIASTILGGLITHVENTSIVMTYALGWGCIHIANTATTVMTDFLHSNTLDRRHTEHIKMDIDMSKKKLE